MAISGFDRELALAAIKGVVHPGKALVVLLDDGLGLGDVLILTSDGMQAQVPITVPGIASDEITPELRSHIRENLADILLKGPLPVDGFQPIRWQTLRMLTQFTVSDGETVRFGDNEGRGYDLGLVDERLVLIMNSEDTK